MSRTRRICKTVVYQILGLIIAFTTSFMVFGELSGSMKLIFIDVFAFSIFYYIYDWTWEKIDAKRKRRSNAW